MSYKNKNRHELLKPGGLLSQQLAVKHTQLLKLVIGSSSMLV